MSTAQNQGAPAGSDGKYHMVLFVAGDEANSRTAKANLTRFCDAELAGRCEIEVVDVLEDSSAALERGIIVTPTLLVRRRGTELRLIGNLSDRDKVRRALGLEGS